jgi:molybdopterin-containing oxidoreductase family iron-sulfur binding subunit
LPIQWQTLNPAPANPHAPMPSQMEPVNRREFLSVMAASLALAGVEGCSPAAVLPEKIVPYVRVPEELLPGKPLHFATAMPFSGYGVGLIVRSEEGRPVKVEGNPRHAASLGATDVFAQASVLNLYDPDRAQAVTNQGAISTLDGFVAALSSRLENLKAAGGAGLRFLSGRITSPSEAAMIDAVLRQFPNAMWHQYEPVNDDNARAGSRTAFGRYVDPLHHFDRADIIVSLDSNFFYWGPARLRHTREFAARRTSQTSGSASGMNRLYVFESTPTITGTKADHRIPMTHSQIGRLAEAIASRLGNAAGGSGFTEQWFEPMVRDLENHRGGSIVIAGETQPPHVHALVHAINEKLGNVGQTVEYIHPVEFRPVEHTSSLKDLAQAMGAGQVDTLVIMDVNPCYSAPADLDFSRNLTKVKLRVSYGLYYDETAAECDWHVPKHHFLEMWGDVRAFDGSVSIIQPLIVPLYATRSPHEFLNIFLGNPTRSNYSLVREFWSGEYKNADFENFWEQSLQEGVVRPTVGQPSPGPSGRPLPKGEGRSAAATPSLAKARPSPFGRGRPEGPGEGSPTTGPENLEVLFRPDPSVYDGSLANNAWLQELPQPLTHLTWDNAVLLGQKTAHLLQVTEGDMVDLMVNSRQITGAVFVVPGQAENTVVVHLGWGRTRAGRNGEERGFNAYALRTSANPWFADGGRIRKRTEKYRLVSTRDHHLTEGRHMVRHLTADEYTKYPDMIQHETQVPKRDDTLYAPFKDIDNAWGMSVDLSRCVGCNACVIACQAENNIPIVGKNEVARGREMHWMRIDTYLEGDAEDPDAYFQPMFCQHCETAPCEYVCPVDATTHSAEGVNEMTYNRCIGTRYCSNNCPYKVRRFNFFQYTVWDVPSFKLLYNPDVTVRSRGVMEKCTYCIQRINRGRIDALKSDRKIKDGEIVTACQQACPAEALVFGNLLDESSKVRKLKSEPRDYSVLAEYNTRPRTTYLAALKNPNPDISGFQTAERTNG